MNDFWERKLVSVLAGSFLGGFVGGGGVVVSFCAMSFALQDDPNFKSANPLDGGRLRIEIAQVNNAGATQVVTTAFTSFDGGFGTVTDPQTGNVIVNFQPKDPNAFKAAYQRASDVVVPQTVPQTQGQRKI